MALYLHQISLYLPQITQYLPQITWYFPKIPLFAWTTTVFACITTVFAYYTTEFVPNTNAFAQNSTVFALNTTEFSINTIVFHQILLYLPPNITEFSQIATVWPKCHYFCSQLPLYLPQIPLYLSQIPLHFFKILLFVKKYCCICDNRHLYFKVFFWQCESRAQRLFWLFPNVNLETTKYNSPRKLGSVYLVVSSLTLGWNCTQWTLHSSFPQPRLWRTWLQSAPCAVSTQVLLSQISSRPHLAALDLADLKMDLVGLEPEWVKSPSLHSAT